MITSERATSMLEGRKIVATHWDFGEDDLSPIGIGILELDDGTLLRMIPNEGCACGAGRYRLVFLHDRVPDNVITRCEVVTTMKGHPDMDPEITYRLFVFMGNERINVANILGHDGSGFEIVVARYDSDPEWAKRLR